LSKLYPAPKYSGNSAWQPIPETCETIINGVRQEAHGRSIPELAKYRDDILLRLLELRADELKTPKRQ
jgi:hypothetical protein